MAVVFVCDRYYGDVLDHIEATNKRCMKDTYRNLVNLVIYNIRKSTRKVIWPIYMLRIDILLYFRYATSKHWTVR